MARTLTERIIAGLLARGERELPSKSSKYRTFTRTFGRIGQPTSYYFVGKAGALRFGTCSSQSIAVSDARKDVIMSYAEQKPAVPVVGGGQ